MGRLPRRQCGGCTRTATHAQMRAWGWYQSSDGSVWCKQHAHLGVARDQTPSGRAPIAAVRSSPTAGPGGPVTAPALGLERRHWVFVVTAIVALFCWCGALSTLFDDDADRSGREAANSASTSPALIARAASTPSSDGHGSSSGAGAISGSTTTGDRPETATVVVTHVIDGDTVEVSSGHRVRLIGIDTPERGQCGYDQATANLASLVRGKEVTLVSGARDNTDQYGRLLRYIEVGNIDAGLEQIKAGYAIARYDSRDGYGAHPREQSYIAADNAAPNYACPDPPRQTTPPAPVQVPPPPPPPPPPAQSNCHPSYTPCVPDVPYDLDCADIGFPVTVIGPDEYGLDNNDPDNIGCESYG